MKSIGNPMAIKITEFVGEASGDCECFCFDKRTREEIERVNRRCPDGFENMDELIRSQSDGRIYPDALLPDGTRGVRGVWRITVEFTPEQSPDLTHQEKAYPWRKNRT